MISVMFFLYPNARNLNKNLNYSNLKIEQSQKLERLAKANGEANNWQKILMEETGALELIEALEKTGEKTSVKVSSCSGDSKIGTCFRLENSGSFPELLQFMQNLENINFFSNLEEASIRYQETEDNYLIQTLIKVYSQDDL